MTRFEYDKFVCWRRLLIITSLYCKFPHHSRAASTRTVQSEREWSREKWGKKMWRNFTLVMCYKSGVKRVHTDTAHVWITYRFNEIQWFRSDFAVLFPLFVWFWIFVVYCRSDADTKWIQLTWTFVRHDVAGSYMRFLYCFFFFYSFLSSFYRIFFFKCDYCAAERIYATLGWLCVCENERWSPNDDVLLTQIDHFVFLSISWIFGLLWNSEKKCVIKRWAPLEYRRMWLFICSRLDGANKRNR